MNDPFADNPERACLGIPDNIFFPDPGENALAAQAQQICHTCPIVDACREWAIYNHEQGIWGGTTDRDRETIRRDRQAEPLRSRQRRTHLTVVAARTQAGVYAKDIAAELGITARTVVRMRGELRKVA